MIEATLQIMPLPRWRRKGQCGQTVPRSLRTLRTHVVQHETFLNNTSSSFFTVTSSRCIFAVN